MKHAQSKSRKQALHRFRGGLRLRIMLVNMIAPLALAIGVLYLGEYRQNLIDAELGTLKVQSQLFAGAIAESAIRPADEGQPFLFATHPFDSHAAPQGETLSPVTAKRIIRRLTETGGSRARVFCQRRQAGGRLSASCTHRQGDPAARIADKARNFRRSCAPSSRCTLRTARFCPIARLSRRRCRIIPTPPTRCRGM